MELLVSRYDRMGNKGYALKHRILILTRVGRDEEGVDVSDPLELFASERI
jgi:hypothetical protein